MRRIRAHVRPVDATEHTPWRTQLQLFQLNPRCS